MSNSRSRKCRYMLADASIYRSCICRSGPKPVSRNFIHKNVEFTTTWPPPLNQLNRLFANFSISGSRLYANDCVTGRPLSGFPQWVATTAYTALARLYSVTAVPTADWICQKHSAPHCRQPLPKSRTVNRYIGITWIAFSLGVGAV